MMTGTGCVANASLTDAPAPPSRRGPTRSIGQVGAWCRARCSERIAPRAMGRPAQELLAHRREPFEWATAGGVRLAFKVGMEPLRLTNPGSAPLLARSHSRRGPRLCRCQPSRHCDKCAPDGQDLATPGSTYVPLVKVMGKVSPLSSSERAISRRRGRGRASRTGGPEPREAMPIDSTRAVGLIHLVAAIAAGQAKCDLRVALGDRACSSRWW